MWRDCSKFLYYSLLVYTKTVDSVKRARWLALFTAKQLGKKWRPSLRPWQVKKSSKSIFCGVYYLTVLVYNKTTIHGSVNIHH